MQVYGILHGYPECSERAHQERKSVNKIKTTSARSEIGEGRL